MSRFKKNILIVCLFLSLIFFILASILGVVSDGKKVPLAYPASGLSDNLFVSQNTDYMENASLPIGYSFKNVPYIVDLLDADTADIDTGHLVYASEDVVFFVSEFPEEEVAHDVILRQYPQAIYMNYAKQNSFIQTATSDIGYINGYHATYFVDHMLISTGPAATAKSAYMIGYILDTGEEYEHDLIIAVATTTESTENFEACKEWLDAMTLTLRLDKQMAERMEKDKQRAFEEEQEAMKEVAKTERGMGDATVSREDRFDSSALPVNVLRDYDNMSMIISWENPCEKPVITFENQNGLIIARPSTLGSRQAIIEVGAIEEGTYILDCSHYQQSGKISVKLIEN